jgi:two-component system chemotaxis sensor kinase CheA
MDEKQNQFIADAHELIEKLYSDLEQLRGARSRGRERRELAARIFRRVHTLKGSAGSFGLKATSQIAHQFEDVLDGVRLGRIELTDAVLDAFEDGTDAIARALESGPTEQTSPAAPVIKRLKALAAHSKGQGAIASSLRATLPSEIARSLSEYDLQHTQEAVREGAKLFIVSAGFAIEAFDQNFRELTKLLGQSGEIISTGPGEPPSVGEINFRLLYAAELVPGDILRQADSLGRIEISEIPIDPSMLGTNVAGDAVPAGLASSDTAETVRVDLNQLNDLISGASELFRYTTNALLSLSASGDKLPFETATRHLRRRFVELEERLLRLRLVPAAEVMGRAAARGGRIASRRLGKQVDFEIVGGDVGIDKSLADTIADPLLHLVRNAVTHGIESVAERKAAGKSEVGRIRLAAFNEGSRIHITVADDGRGIDWERIVAAARASGITNDASNLTTDQCLRLIFRPGFSTASKVSELSGRGIGLDIVDRAMEQAGGEVRVATEIGSGTTFAMIMPATLALVQCLLVQSGDQLYAIESTGIVQGETKHNGHADSAEEQSPVFHLSSLLGQADARETEGTSIFWRAHGNSAGGAMNQTSNEGDLRYTLIVDDVKGHQETLVRSLGRHAARWAGVCGAAELFDGQVALVLDVEELIKNTQGRVVEPGP